jgi:hypothetical protein
MACRGVHFALNEEEAKKVSAALGDDERLMSIIQEDIEEQWDENWLAETDKAWDAIHRCLTDGRLSCDAPTPQHLCILGGKALHAGDAYIVSFVSPEQVKQVAAAIANMDRASMRTRYLAIPEEDYGQPLSEEDFEYTWEYFQGVRELFAKAAKAGRAVIFTVDQ